MPNVHIMLFQNEFNFTKYKPSISPTEFVEVIIFVISNSFTCTQINIDKTNLEHTGHPSESIIP